MSSPSLSKYPLRRLPSILFHILSPFYSEDHLLSSGSIDYLDILTQPSLPYIASNSHAKFYAAAASELSTLTPATSQVSPDDPMAPFSPRLQRPLGVLPRKIGRSFPRLCSLRHCRPSPTLAAGRTVHASSEHTSTSITSLRLPRTSAPCHIHIVPRSSTIPR